MALRIGIDIDGVLADFRAAFRAAARQCLGRAFEAAEDPKTSKAMAQADVRKVWDWVEKKPNWWMGLRPYEPDQIAKLYSLTRSAGWEVFFLTNRPASGGDTAQFQSQSWIEQHGFYMPSVLTVPGSRGDIANGLRLDLVIDDQMLNCVEVVSASTAKAILMLRSHDQALSNHAINRGIGVVSNLVEAITVLERLREELPSRRGRLMRLTDWFNPSPERERLPDNPRAARPLPPLVQD
ncbi:MAG: hypothetical protein LC753_05210 [Acidobacteria bacterium]|nr:hypothetical protein [Acidobacteriota bacterium]